MYPEAGGWLPKWASPGYRDSMVELAKLFSTGWSHRGSGYSWSVLWWIVVGHGEHIA